MEELDVPFLDVTLEESTVEEVVQKTVEVVRPNWDYAKVKHKKLQQGYLNLTFRCYEQAGNAEEDANDDAIVFKTVREIFSGDFDETIKMYKFLTDQHLGQKLLAVFRNGVCLSYLNGESMVWGSEKQYDTMVWKAIAEEMARWHQMDVFNAAVQSGIRKTLPTNVDIDEYWDSIMTRDPMKQYQDHLPSKMELAKEFAILEDILLETGDLEFRFCHTDVNSTNIVLQRGGDLRFIDYEFTGIHYIQFDLSWFFRSINERIWPDDSIPGYEYEFNFLRHYLKHRNRLDNLPDPDHSEVETLYNQVQKCKLFISLRYIVMVGTMHDQFRNAEMFIPVICDIWENFSANKVNVLSKYS